MFEIFLFRSGKNENTFQIKTNISTNVKFGDAPVDTDQY